MLFTNLKMKRVKLKNIGNLICYLYIKKFIEVKLKYICKLIDYLYI